jgi:hypothetical protein
MALRTVLVAGITHGRMEASIAFGTGLLRLQGELVRTPTVTASIKFFDALGDALSFFAENECFELMVAMDVRLGCETAFVVQPLEPGKAFVVGVYPMPGVVNWNRVESKIRTDDNVGDIAEAGAVYNIDEASSIGEPGNCRYLKIDASKARDLGVLKISRKVIIDLASASASPSDKKVYPRTGLDLASAWKGAIYADTSIPFTSFGAQSYSGSIGIRTAIARP